MNQDRIEELISAFAAGEISAVELAEVGQLLRQAPEAVRQHAANLIDASTAVAATLPTHVPPASLKAKLLSRIEGSKRHAQTASATPAPPPFTFIFRDSGEGWQPLPVPGASVKLLSVNQERGFAVVLGKLDPGARYPAHTHIQGEDVYIISGDLHIGDVAMRAGDFHHAEAGTRHEVNWSEHGCVILAVLSVQDLQAQFAAAST